MKQAFLTQDAAENEAARLKYTKRTNISVKKVVHPQLGDIWTVTSEFKFKNVRYKKA